MKVSNSFGYRFSLSEHPPLCRAAQTLSVISVTFIGESVQPGVIVVRRRPSRTPDPGRILVNRVGKLLSRREAS